MTSYTIAVYLFVHFQSPHSLHCIASHRIVSPYLACSSSLYRCAHTMACSIESAWCALNRRYNMNVKGSRARVCVCERENACMINTWNIHPKRLWWNQNNSSTIVTSGRIKFRYIRYVSEGGGGEVTCLCAWMCVHVCVCVISFRCATHMYSMLFLWYFTFIFVQI